MDEADQDLPQKIRQAKQECYSCHTAKGQAQGAASLSEADRAKLAGLVLDPEKFDGSVHADLFCKDCHGEGVSNTPHRPADGIQAKSCPQCHKGHNATILPEVERSVHGVALANAFSCYSCHDPHNVRKAASLGTQRNIAHRDNSMCRGCHDSDEQYGKVSSKKRPNLLLTHSWQPNPALHWSAVRCIDCHTPEKPGGAISHEVLPKAQAQRFCVDCHSTNSSLLTRLYRHQVEEGRVSGAGFVNAYILTQAYVVGVTRNQYLDDASIILMSALLAGLGGHALLRYLGSASRKRRK